MTTASTTHAATVEFDHVTKVYGASAAKAGTPGAVNDLSLTVPAGKICVLVGPSGCGKTTSLKMVNRLIEPTSGRILLDGVDAATRNVTELRRGIGYVIQQTGLFPHQTIEENVATVPRLLGWSKARRHERAEELLALIGLDPAAYAGRYPAQLSGGERQRVGVARALAADPPIMLMDEPFGAVDPIVRERLQNEFLRLQEQLAKTILFVTHDIDEAIKMGDLVAVFRAGGVVEQFGPPSEILGGPGVAVRRPVRRRGPRAQAPVPDAGQRPGAGTVGDGAGRRRRGGGASTRHGRSVRVPAAPRRRRSAAGLGRPAPGPRGGGARRRARRDDLAAARPANHAQGRPVDPPRQRRPGGRRRRPSRQSSEGVITVDQIAAYMRDTARPSEAADLPPATADLVATAPAGDG